MRQRNAFQYDDHSLHHASDDTPPAISRLSGQPRPRASNVAPRFSLPQRTVIVESTLADTPAIDSPPQFRKPARSKKPSTKAIAVVPEPISPLEAQATSSLADLHLIPRTQPAVAAVSIKQRLFHRSSPRMTIIKLSLISLVVFSVLGATLATAGGGRVSSFLFSALESIIPYAPSSQPAGQLPVVQRVHPITQADLNAGYDSRQQHDLWWNAACSAAVFTELAHAWGISGVTIGETIDEMSAHSPPYITPYGGLMSQNAWGYIAGLYHLKAAVHTNHSMSYDDVVRMTEGQGIPVVLNLRDNGGRYYPAFGVGHFLIAVGGDASGLRIVDSSLYRITYLPTDEVNYLWTGVSIVITQ